MTQFIRLSRPEILHALTEAAYRKAGFRQGTGVKGVISSFSMGGEGRPSQATIKLDVTAATLPEQAAEQHMEAASADLAVEVGDADLYLDPDTSTIETVAHAAWDLLKTIPFEFLPVDCREAMG